MSTPKEQTWDEQEWTDEVQVITLDYVDENHDLGELMLDHSESYWRHSFQEGLTPQEALDGLIAFFEKNDVVAKHKRAAALREAHDWWKYKMEKLLLELSRISDDKEELREDCKNEIELLMQEIEQRYRAVEGGK